MVSVYGGMSHERKTKIWTMWQQGIPMSHIARDIKKPPATVYSYLLYHGGIEPKTRIRRSSCLTFKSERLYPEALPADQVCGILPGNLIVTHPRFLGKYSVMVG
jgi:hypothetical protein